MAPFPLVSSSNAVADAIFGIMGLWGALMAFIWIFYCLLFLFGIAVFVLWVWLLVDCIRCKNFENENDKLIWVLVMVFTGILGAALYYFMVKRKKDMPSPGAKEPSAGPVKPKVKPKVD